jgi:hypothetical protein
VNETATPVIKDAPLASGEDLRTDRDQNLSTRQINVVAVGREQSAQKMGDREVGPVDAARVAK